jgi:hypothetical protein
MFKNKTGPELFLEICGFLALTLVFFVACIDAAYATGNNHNDDNEQTQDQHQGQDQAQDQNQTATGGNASASQTQGNEQSLVVNESKRPDDITIRNTAAANMPNLTATSPCVVSWSGGLGIAGANLGGGKTKIDPECNIRETARTFAGLGEISQALIIACTSEVARAALGDACGITRDNVYVRVNETVRYVERATDDRPAVHDVSKEAVDTCTESTTRAFEGCVSK